MNGLSIRPIIPNNISSAHVQENIRVIFKEVDSLKSNSSFSGKSPTYRTVRQFSIYEVFVLFWIKKVSII